MKLENEFDGQKVWTCNRQSVHVKIFVAKCIGEDCREEIRFV